MEQDSSPGHQSSFQAVDVFAAGVAVTLPQDVDEVSCRSREGSVDGFEAWTLVERVALYEKSDYDRASEHGSDGSSIVVIDIACDDFNIAVADDSEVSGKKDCQEHESVQKSKVQEGCVLSETSSEDQPLLQTKYPDEPQIVNASAEVSPATGDYLKQSLQETLMLNELTEMEPKLQVSPEELLQCPEEPLSQDSSPDDLLVQESFIEEASICDEQLPVENSLQETSSEPFTPDELSRSLVLEEIGEMSLQICLEGLMLPESLPEEPLLQETSSQDSSVPEDHVDGTMSLELTSFCEEPSSQGSFTDEKSSRQEDDSQLPTSQEYFLEGPSTQESLLEGPSTQEISLFEGPSTQEFFPEERPSLEKNSDETEPENCLTEQPVQEPAEEEERPDELSRESSKISLVLQGTSEEPSFQQTSLEESSFQQTSVEEPSSQELPPEETSTQLEHQDKPTTVDDYSGMTIHNYSGTSPALQDYLQDASQQDHQVTLPIIDPPLFLQTIEELSAQEEHPDERSTLEDNSDPDTEEEEDFPSEEVWQPYNLQGGSLTSSASSTPLHAVPVGGRCIPPDLLEEANRIEELDQMDSSLLLNHDLPADVNLSNIQRERHYIHQRNRRLNVLLSLLVAFSMAAAIGFGIGHFIGLSDNFPPRPGCSASLPAASGDQVCRPALSWSELSVRLERAVLDNNHLASENDDLRTTIGRIRYGRPARSSVDADMIRRLEMENRQLRTQVDHLKRHQCSTSKTPAAPPSAKNNTNNPKTVMDDSRLPSKSSDCLHAGAKAGNLNADWFLEMGRQREKSRNKQLNADWFTQMARHREKSRADQWKAEWMFQRAKTRQQRRATDDDPRAERKSSRGVHRRTADKFFSYWNHFSS